MHLSGVAEIDVSRLILHRPETLTLTRGKKKVFHILCRIFYLRSTVLAGNQSPLHKNKDTIFAPSGCKKSWSIWIRRSTGSIFWLNQGSYDRCHVQMNWWNHAILSYQKGKYEMHVLLSTYFSCGQIVLRDWDPEQRTAYTAYVYIQFMDWIWYLISLIANVVIK